MIVPPLEFSESMQAAARPSELGGYDLELPLAELERPLNPERLFGRRAPFAIEVGSGSGYFLAVEAMRRPEWNFLAIERDGASVKKAKDKWRRRGLLNTRVIRCDAHYLLEEAIADQSVDEYIILYSDPWPKVRHHKRRFFQPRLLPTLERTLKPGCRLFIKTDVTAYYDVMVELFAGAPFLALEEDRRVDLDPPEGDIVTNFQRKAVEKGHPLHQLIYRRL